MSKNILGYLDKFYCARTHFAVLLQYDKAKGNQSRSEIQGVARDSCGADDSAGHDSGRFGDTLTNRSVEHLAVFLRPKESIHPIYRGYLGCGGFRCRGRVAAYAGVTAQTQ